MPDIIGVGESDIDIFLKVKQPPGRGEKVRATELGKLPGGIIGNFCSGVVKHGVSCGIVSVLGDDENGRIALGDYARRGVETTHLRVKEGGQTFYCVVFLDASGEKYLTAVPSELISPALEDIDLSYLQTARYVHLCSMDYTLACHVVNGLRGGKTRVSLDYEAHAERPGFASWQGIFTGVHTLFVNEEGLHSLFPAQPVEQAIAELFACGIQLVALTCAERGGTVFTPEGRYPYRAFLARDIQDTTGAGDCFNAALLSSRLLEMPLAEGVRYAAAASALAIQHVGARTGLPSRAEILEFLAAEPPVLEPPARRIPH